MQSKDGVILPTDSHPHVCSIRSPCRDTFPWRIFFFVIRVARKRDKAVKAELVLAALKKQALAWLQLGWLCTRTPGWLREHAWCQAVLHTLLGGCEAVPAVVVQAFGMVGGPPWGCFRKVLWVHLKLEVNQRDKYWTDTRPVPSQIAKDICFPMPFSSVGPLRPSIPKFSEWSLGLRLFLKLLTSAGCFGFRYRDDYPWLVLCPLTGSITTAAFSFGSVCVGNQKAEEECRVMI